eukprot:TRINITY_DN303_c0_g4_i3.p1 TRINITY_DN303_c0_g4~~TRINITY_DN303_c0_g4_i3.p1  ORF type:complete len:126 (-),score=34.16 TRINITY_DN303_c0_g4_i3:107-484(-)
MESKSSEEGVRQVSDQPQHEDEDISVQKPPAKKKKVLDHEQIFLDALPSATMYEKSYMHRDIVSHVAVTATDFIITGSIDGQVKFWKKMSEGVEFVKHYKSHLGTVESAYAFVEVFGCIAVLEAY